VNPSCQESGRARTPLRAAELTIFAKFRRDIGLAPWQMKRMMKNLKKCLIFLSGIVLFAGCGQNNPPAPPAPPRTNTPPPAATPAAPEKEVAVISTTEGDMVVEFWTDAATNTVANFKKLANGKFYDGTAFHRIMKGFMVQGGDPNTKDPNNKASYGTGGPGYAINDEKNDHKHERGVIAMANSGPNSAGSQFYICLAPQPRLDQMNYTTFGHLIKGDDVLEKIGNTPVERDRRGEMSAPTKRVEVISIKLVPASSVK
jgi:peptidyl-prolyl cis-trans isomerase B (cyclophilin B)